MTTSRHRWPSHLLSSAAFAIIAASSFQVNAAVTACETTALTNANFEATAGGKAAQWCDDYARGYSRVLLTAEIHGFENFQVAREIRFEDYSRTLSRSAA